MLSSIWIFIAVHFWAVIGTISGISTVLIVVAVACFGWQITTMITAVINFARAAIGFFETPLGELIALAMLGVAIWTFADAHRIRLDHAAYEITLHKALNNAAREADDARKARDAWVKQQVSADAEKRISVIEDQKKDLEQKAQEYETALENSKGASCLVGSGDMPVRVQNHRWFGAPAGH